MLTNSTPKSKQKTSSCAASTSQISLFPKLMPEITVQTRICTQASWLIGRMGHYMRLYYNNVTHSPGRPPISQSISNITGLNCRTISSHLSKQAQVAIEIEMPRCCQP